MIVLYSNLYRYNISIIINNTFYTAGMHKNTVRRSINRGDREWFLTSPSVIRLKSKEIN